VADLANPVIVANGVELHDYGVGTSDPVSVVSDAVNLTPLDTTGVDTAVWELLKKPVGSACVVSQSGMNASLSPAPDVGGEYVFKLTFTGQNRRKTATAYLIVCEVTTAQRLKLIPSGISLRDRDAFYRDRHNELAEAVDTGSGGGGAGGGGSLSGDASSIRTVLVDAILPQTSGQTLRYDASRGIYVAAQLTQDDILTGFWITSFTRPAGNIAEIGQTVTGPTFTAGYSALPVATATLTDTQGTAPRDVSSTPTSFSSLGAFTKLVNGQSVTFTLSASKDGHPASATFAMYWGMRRFFGASAATSGFDWAFAHALPSSELALSRARGATNYTLAAGQRWVTAWAKTWGTPSWIVNGYPTTPDILADDVEPPAWQSTHAYVAGEWVQNGGNAYRCQTGGTSASSGGPTGTGLAIADGTAVWNYVGAASSVRLTICALSDFATGASSYPWSAS